MSDFGEFVDVVLEGRIGQAALALASARAARAANGTIRTLVRDGLISAEQGTQLSLRISGQLEREGAAPVVERQAAPAIEASTQAEPDLEHEPDPVAADDVRRCPICGVPISIQASACIRHWRQAKREAGDG